MAVNVCREVDVGYFGAKADGLTDDTAAIQKAVNYALEGSDKCFTTIRLLPGTHIITAPVGIVANGDTRCRMHIVGTGRRLSQIYQRDDGADVFNLQTAGGNIRDFVMDNVTLLGGRRGLNLLRAEYNLFRNVVFSKNKEYGLYSYIGGIGNLFDQCWWVHLAGNVLGMGGSGSLVIRNSVIGEDVGSIDAGSEVTLTNCNMWGMADKLRGNGMYDAGKSAINIMSGASLKINGCKISPSPEAANCFWTDKPRAIAVADTSISVPAGAALLNVRNAHTGAEPFSGVQFTGNRVDFLGSGKFYTTAKNGQSIRNSIIADNQIKARIGEAVTFEDYLLDPAHNNHISGNIVRRG